MVNTLQCTLGPKYIGVQAIKPSMRPNIAWAVCKLILCHVICAMENAYHRHCILVEQAGAVLGHGERKLIQSFHCIQCISREWKTSVEYTASIVVWNIWFIPAVIYKTQVQNDINKCVKDPCTSTYYYICSITSRHVRLFAVEHVMPFAVVTTP